MACYCWLLIYIQGETSQSFRSSLCLLLSPVSVMTEPESEAGGGGLESDVQLGGDEGSLDAEVKSWRDCSRDCSL